MGRRRVTTTAPEPVESALEPALEAIEALVGMIDGDPTRRRTVEMRVRVASPAGVVEHEWIVRADMVPGGR